jgi:hypothetical protein
LTSYKSRSKLRWIKITSISIDCYQNHRFVYWNRQKSSLFRLIFISTKILTKAFKSSSIVLYLELLNINKFSFFYENDLILMINDHKIWTRVMSCKFQHSVQKISIYERYKWALSLDALFHFQMNMIDAILKIHYEFIKFSFLFRSNLRIHAEFWNRKKIRFDNFEFHATQEFIIQSYKTCVVVIF